MLRQIEWGVLKWIYYEKVVVLPQTTFLKTETENKNLLFSVGLRYQIPNVHIHSFYKRLYLISVFTVSIFKYV